MTIPPTRIFIPEEDKDWILEKARGVLDSAILTEGNYCKELEKSLARYLQVRNVVVTNSGTGALEAMIRSSGIRGADIVVTTETFSATIYAIIRSGNRPVFADVGPDMSLSLPSIKAVMTPKTRSVMLVHIGGFISDSAPEIKEFCLKNNIALFEDAAQSMGSKYDGLSPGKFGLSAGFSLFPTKVMASAEGGFIATEDDTLAEKARIFKDQGKTKGNFCSVQGYNWRMSELQAIIGLTQLKRLDQFIQARDRVTRVYDEKMQRPAFSRKLSKMEKSTHCNPNWYKYIVFLKDLNRETLKQNLKNQKISLSGEVYEVPCHVQDAFAEYGYKKGDFPIAEEICSSHICFPLTSNMTPDHGLYFMEQLERNMN